MEFNYQTVLQSSTVVPAPERSFSSILRFSPTSEGKALKLPLKTKRESLV